jgi:hypothetical protein
MNKEAKKALQETRKKSTPNILFFDIETAPNIGAFYEYWKEGNIVWTDKHWYIMSFAWKWYGQKKASVCALTDFKEYKKDRENDKELVSRIWALMDAADIVVAHNGRAFDTKKAMARFLVHGIVPPRPFKEVDTLLIARSVFRFDSNRLDDIAQSLKVGRKMPHQGWKMWKDCMDGDRKAWAEMKRYNANDVELLEKVYLAMRPYIKNHPNLALLKGMSHACPNCGGVNLEEKGSAYGRVTTSERMRCLDCGAWSTRPWKEKKDGTRQVR